MSGVVREFGVVSEQPEPCPPCGIRRDSLYIETTLARDDHDAADRWHPAQSRQAVGSRRSDKEPVPRKEGRLH